jgi:hypothetical protein
VSSASLASAVVPRARWLGTWVLVPLLIELVAWQPIALAPAPGLDPSWGAGLELAVHNHLSFGTQVVFTYGPLGFLSIPFIGYGATWFNHLGQAALLYVAFVRFGVAVAIFAGARRMYGLVAGAVIAAVVASVANQFGELIIALVIAVCILWRPGMRRRDLLVCAALGAFAALELLDKTSIGTTVAVMSVLLVVSLPGHRRECAAITAAAFAVALVGLWLVLHQSLGDLPSYVGNSERIAAGYSAAMAFDAGVYGWTHTAALVAVGVGLWAAFDMTAFSPTRARYGIVALWLVFCFSAFKEAFVRLDAAHLPIFFDAALGGFFAFTWRQGRRTVALVATAMLTVFALAAQAQSITGLLQPSRNLSAAIAELRDLASSSRRAALIAAGRASIAAAEPLTSPALALVQGQTVSVFPYDIAVAWAYHLKWRPLPVLQSYVAYTSALDTIDASFLRSAKAPSRLLVQGLGNGGIDGRVLSFDEPETSREILCRYRLLLATGDFAVLGRSPDRCSAPVPLKTTHADWGQPVAVPAPPVPSSLVFVRISGIGVAAAERLADVLYKPQIRSISINGGASNRLIAGTAGDGLPLRAARGVDYPYPYQLAPEATSIAVGKHGQGPTGGQPITYSFYAQTVGR